MNTNLSPVVQPHVELLVDLTDYHPAFKAGVVGTVEYRAGILDPFFIMRLPTGESLMVLWKSVKSINEKESA
jgi:hypothetical protein